MNDSVEPQLGLGSIDIVLFSAAGWRVGLEARWVRNSRSAPEQATGHLIEDLLGMACASATAATAPRQFLQLKLPGGDIDILVGAPVELFSLPARAIHAVPPMLAARTGLRAIRALALAPTLFGQDAILLFDACALPSPAGHGTAPGRLPPRSAAMRVAAPRGGRVSPWGGPAVKP
jgi:hypothetical protein